MTASTPIANLVRSMLADGLDHDAIVRAVEAAEAALRPQRTSGVRGTRLPADWIAPESYIAYAVERGMPADRVSVEVEKFRNYWTAKSGAGATKRDWEATWRNWILNAMERHRGGARNGSALGAHSAPGRATTGADAILTGMARLARRVAEDRMPARSRDGEMAKRADTPKQLTFDRNRT
jgi:hypothetical protein